MSQRENTYNFYYVIYNLRNPSSNVRLGNSTILKFNDLPKKTQEHFVGWWKRCSEAYREWARTEDELIRKKRAFTFLHLKVRARTDEEAEKDALRSVRDEMSILSFLYGVYLPIHLGSYSGEDFSVSGGPDDYYYIPNLWICEYQQV